MLDIHPPHASTHTWRDFFIHVATICVGLLIAIGLEQTVEFFHHHYQVAETRKVLRDEREQNHARLAYTAAGFRLHVEMLRNNLLILQYARQHPGTPQDKLPGVMTWFYHNRAATQSGWKTAQQTGITALMPREEVSRNELLYGILSDIDTTWAKFIDAFSKATRYRSADQDITHMTPAQLDEEVVLMEDLIQANYRLGERLVNLHDFAPDFDTVTAKERDALERREMSDADKHSLATAQALTDTRLDNTQAAFDKIRNAQPLNAQK